MTATTIITKMTTAIAINTKISELEDEFTELKLLAVDTLWTPRELKIYLKTEFKLCRTKPRIPITIIAIAQLALLLKNFPKALKLCVNGFES